MALWTEELFKQVAQSTKLSEGVKLACHDVLVDGFETKEAAERHGKLSPAVSRGLSTLRTKLKEIEQAAMSIRDLRESLKVSAINMARGLTGESLKVIDAKPGHSYQGKVLCRNEGYLVQNIGRDAVIHDVGKLEKIPGSHENLVEISYKTPDGMASVVEATGHEMSRYSGPERRSR